MAKASDIIRAIAAGFVSQTELFSRIVSITSLSASGGVVTAVCATPHGYLTGNYVYIAGAEAPVQVSSLTRVGNIVTAITVQDHDLTKNDQEYYTPQVKIYGADQSAYNGTFNVLLVPNRNKFTYTVSGSPVTPATGTILAVDGKERGYNGIKQITVIDETTFTYEITGNPQPAIGTIVSHSNVRVSGAVDDERAIESYTKQSSNDYWAFVILDNTDPSKDRSILNDSTGSPVVGNDYRQMMMQNFHILVFAPTKNEIAAREARDTMEDIYVYLVKCLCRSIFNTGFIDSDTFKLISLGHDKFEYYKGFYVHKFNWQISNFIIYGDTIAPDINVAFRDISLIINNSENELVTAEINLDEQQN